MNRTHEIIFRLLTTAFRTHPLPQVGTDLLFLCACFVSDASRKRLRRRRHQRRRIRLLLNRRLRYRRE